MRDYEMLYILRPELDDEEQSEAMAAVDSLVVAHSGEVTKHTAWGKRRLAYAIDKMREGYYALCEFRIEQTQLPELEAALKISDSVFRHLVTARPRPELLKAASVRRRSRPRSAGGDSAAVQAEEPESSEAESVAVAAVAAETSNPMDSPIEAISQESTGE